MEELRAKHKSLQSAAHHIALDCIHQPAHGSPYHVHPYPSPIRLQHAFQNNQNSPKMFHPKGLKTHLSSVTPNESPILGRALCLTPRSSPVLGQVSHLSDRFQDSLTLTSDTDTLVAKISAMFPTVSETHIKILLKKYYNREAVVISALQVEKHPITTPGPLTMSPSAARLHKGAIGVYSALQLAKGVSGSVQGSAHVTPLTGTPYGSPSLLRPASGASYYGFKSVDGQSTKHQSPKMKLKYLKSIFQKAEETLILDVLANKDNNVQKASEELISMGFTKKDTSLKQLNKTEKEAPLPPKKVINAVKTTEEKNALKEKLEKKYNTVAERVVSIALESVDYNEERAEQILMAVVNEDVVPENTKVVEIKEPTKRILPAEVIDGFVPTHHQHSLVSMPGEERQQSPAHAVPASRRLKNWTEHLKPILKTTGNSETNYKSPYHGKTQGPNTTLRQGPQDKLLLLDYMTWNGPNPELCIGQAVKADGPKAYRKSATLARGPSGKSKGPARLAKGSTYQQINKNPAKIIVE